MTKRNRTLRSTPVKSFASLGAVDRIADIGDRAMEVPQVLARDYSFDVPLATNTFDAFFGNSSYNLLGTTQSALPPVGEGTSSSFVQGDSVPCYFLLRGVSVKILVDPDMFSLTGLAFPTPAASVATPAFDGSDLTGLAGSRPGVLQHGIASKMLAHGLLRTRSLRMRMGCDFDLFDQTMGDIGMVCPDTKYIGFGTSQEAAIEYVRQTNDRLRTLSSPYIFVPTNIDAAGDPLAPPIPSQGRGSFDPCGTMNGMYELKSPVLLGPGIPLQLYMDSNTNDDTIFESYVESVRYDGSTVRTYDLNLTENLSGGAGDRNAGTVLFQSGKVRMEIVFIGNRLTAKACAEWASMQGGASGLGGFLAGLPSKDHAHQAIAKYRALGAVNLDATKERTILAGIPST